MVWATAGEGAYPIESVAKVGLTVGSHPFVWI